MVTRAQRQRQERARFEAARRARVETARVTAPSGVGAVVVKAPVGQPTGLIPISKKLRISAAKRVAQFLRRTAGTQRTVVAAISKLRAGGNLSLRERQSIILRGLTLQQALTGGRAALAFGAGTKASLNPRPFKAPVVTKVKVGVTPVGARLRQIDQFRGRIKTTPTSLERRAQKLTQREAKLESFKQKVFGRLGIRAATTRQGFFRSQGTVLKNVGSGAIEVLKAAARFPLELASLPVVIGGRAALAVDASFDRRTRQRLPGLKETAKAVITAFDPRRPEGILNIALIGFGVRVTGKSLSLARQTRVLNSELSGARVIRAKTTITKGPGGNRIKVSKGVAKTKSGKQFAFEERVTIKKGVKTGDFSGKSISNFRISGKSFKGLATKIKGKQAVIRTSPTTEITVVRGVQRGRGVRTTFESLGEGKTVFTRVQVKKGVRLIDTKLKNIKSPKGKVTKFDSVSFEKFLPKKTIAAKLRSSIKSIDKNIRSRTISPSQRLKLLVARNNLARSFNSLKFRGKKANIALTRGTGSGLETGARPTVSKPLKSDALLRTLDKRIARIRGITKPKVSKVVRIRSAELEALLPNSFNLVIPRLVVLPVAPVVSQVLSVSQVIGETISKPVAGVPSVARPIVGATPEPISKPSTITQPIARVGVASASRTSPSNTPADFFFPDVPFAPPLLGTSFFPVGAVLPLKGTGLRKFLSKLGIGLRRVFRFNPDVASILFGRRATPRQRRELLRVGRVFTGLEDRLLVR